MPMITDTERAEHIAAASAALDAFLLAHGGSGEREDGDAVDLITDLLHYVAQTAGVHEAAELADDAIARFEEEAGE